MKKFLLLTLLAGVFTLMSTTSADAQRFGNRTNCPMLMKAAYGFPGCGVVAATAAVVVPPLSVVNVPLPVGMEFLYGKGLVIGIGCPFYVGPCGGYPATVAVPCAASPCGNYRASLFPGWGIVAYI